MIKDLRIITNNIKMSTDTTNTSGISPVLLQAISERLGSKGASSIASYQTNIQSIKTVNVIPRFATSTMKVVPFNTAVSEKIVKYDSHSVGKCVTTPADNHRTDSLDPDCTEQFIINSEKISIPKSLLPNKSNKIVYLQEDIQVVDEAQDGKQEISLCCPNDIPIPINDVIITSNESNESRTLTLSPQDEALATTVIEYVEQSPSLDNSDTVSDPGTSTTPSYVPLMTNANNSKSAYAGQACPICGDRVSGYHYGVISCESCKGFFKRTVQNRRSFVCPRQGDCNIMVINRKKCPSCRFGRCVMAGMKIEAIRTDRSRGGRSYYEGCSPRIRPKTERPKQKITPKPYNRASPSSQSHLVAILNSQPGPSLMPVPQLLVDIMNLENMLKDKTSPADADVAVGDNAAMYGKLLQLAELRLYKLVRWARALPQFSSIPTEDQIIMLQNSWLDLLILGVAYSSMHHPGVIHINSYFEWSLDDARAIGMEQIFVLVVNLADLMYRINLDKYECAVLKVLAIISPDVDGLAARHVVLEQQQTLSEALHQYAESHYPSQRNRFSQLLLILSGLIKASILGKALLSSENLGEHFYQCDLLMELIQGRNNPTAT